MSKIKKARLTDRLAQDPVLKDLWDNEKDSAFDSLVEKEKARGKSVKPGKEFSEYIKKITK